MTVGTPGTGREGSLANALPARPGTTFTTTTSAARAINAATAPRRTLSRRPTRTSSWSQTPKRSAVEDHLGHATIRTTRHSYGHVYDSARERLRDHLDNVYDE
jgi:integrase